MLWVILCEYQHRVRGSLQSSWQSIVCWWCSAFAADAIQSGLNGMAPVLYINMYTYLHVHLHLHTLNGPCLAPHYYIYIIKICSTITYTRHIQRNSIRITHVAAHLCMCKYVYIYIYIYSAKQLALYTRSFCAIWKIFFKLLGWFEQHT